MSRDTKDVKDISALSEKYSTLQARRLQAKKDLIALKNDIASKEELYKMQQKKYDAMKLEIEQRGLQIKNLEEELNEYAHMDPKASALDSYNDMIEKFLSERNIKRELNQLLYDENRKTDDKFMIGNAHDEDESVEELPPDEEAYAKAMTESITVKFIRKRNNKEENKKSGKKEDEEDDFKKLSSIMSFRINKDTTFAQLKEAAGNFWETSKHNCDYFLTDESGAQLPVENKVEEYFKTQLQDIHNVLLILKPREPSKNLTAGMIDAISTGDQQASGQVGHLSFNRTKKTEVDGYAEFFDDFPGMKNYIDEDKLKERKKVTSLMDEDKKSRFIDDNHCCIAFLIFLILLISVICVPLDRNVSYDHKLQSSLYKVLLIGEEFIDMPTSYFNIMSIQGVYTYLATCVMQTAVNAPRLFQNNVYVGPLRIRQVRTKKRDSCVTVASSSQTVFCYYDVYNENTRDTTPFINPTDYGWKTFHTAEENGISSKIEGLNAMYDGSGYVADFNMMTMTVIEAQMMFYNMVLSNFLDLGTRALFITTNLYNPLFGRFIEIQLGFEFTAGGYVLPMPPSVKIYRLIRYATEHYGVRYEILQGIAAVLLLVFLLYMTFTNEHGRRHLNWRYWLTFPAISTLVLNILVFLSINANQKLRDLNLDFYTLYNNQKFFDSGAASKLYSDTIFFECLGVFVASVRLIYFLRLSANFELIINTISRAGIIFVQYIATLIPVLASFGVIGMLLWGDVSLDFNIRGNAFISIMALPLGHFDTEILSDADIYLTAVLLTLYYFFFIFFLITVFTSLTIDTYRLVQMERNAEESGKKTEFKLFVWLFAWVPTKYIEKFQDWVKAKWTWIKSICKSKEEEADTKTEENLENKTEVLEKKQKKKDKKKKLEIKEDIPESKERMIEMKTAI